MYANMIVFLYLLFATFKDCTLSNIFSYLSSKCDTPFVIPAEASKEVENIYIQSFISDVPRDDPICALTAGRKKALCERIFQISHYRSTGIYLNKVALHLARLPCEEKILFFKHRSDFRDKTFKQKMYPCHGRHEPVRTSIIEDSYYDAIYISGGPDLDSVTVYLHAYDVTSDWYIVYDYIHNVDVPDLRDMFITVKEVTAELKLNRNIISTVGYRELEIIFLREQDYLKIDPICDLEYEKKISLCTLIFSSASYWDKFHVALNKAAVYMLDMACEKNLVSIVGFPKSRRTAQDMYPCYARKEPATGNVLSDPFIKRFYVSRGPRRNSVFVYACEYDEDHGAKFSIFDLFENVYTRNLKPTEITYEQVVEESPTTYLKVQELEDAEERSAKQAERFAKSLSKGFARENVGSKYETDERLQRKLSQDPRTDEAEQTFSKVIESIRKPKKPAIIKSTSKGVTKKIKKPEKLEEIKSKREEETRQSLEMTLKMSEGKIKAPILDVMYMGGEAKKSDKDRKPIELFDVQIGPQVTKRLKAKRETELASKKYFEATTSSERLRIKLANRKLMTKSESTLTEEEKFAEEEAKKLIEKMEKSLRIKKAAEGKLPEKGKIIPEKNEEGVEESNKKDSKGNKKKKPGGK